MKQHTNRALQIDFDTVFDAVRDEMFSAQQEHGGFNSMHELYAVLLEEVEEFWDSVKEKDPDPAELIQVAATAIRGVLVLTDIARQEIKEKAHPS